MSAPVTPGLRVTENRAASGGRCFLRDRTAALRLHSDNGDAALESDRNGTERPVRHPVSVVENRWRIEDVGLSRARRAGAARQSCRSGARKEPSA